jgi:hypothetical protein
MVDTEVKAGTGLRVVHPDLSQASLAPVEAREAIALIERLKDVGQYPEKLNRDTKELVKDAIQHLAELTAPGKGLDEALVEQAREAIEGIHTQLIDVVMVKLGAYKVMGVDDRALAFIKEQQDGHVEAIRKSAAEQLARAPKAA